MFHWLSKDSRSRDLSCNLRKSFKHKGENGRVSILLVRARLHPHSLRLSPDWSFISTTSYFCLNFKTCQRPRWLLLRRHQSDGSFHHQLWRPQQFWSCKIIGRVIRWARKYAHATRKRVFLPLSLGNCLHLVAFRFSREFHLGSNLEFVTITILVKPCPVPTIMTSLLAPICCFSRHNSLRFPEHTIQALLCSSTEL